MDILVDERASIQIGIALSVRLKGQFFLKEKQNNEQHFYELPKTDVHF